jgi:hypothetical protein
MIKDKPRSLRNRAWEPGILGDDLAFPLRVEKIPIRADLVRPYQVGVVSDVGLARSLKEENMLSFRIDVVMFSLEPFGDVGNLRQHERRLDWIQSFCGMKNRKRSIGTSDFDIGEIFSCPALGQHFNSRLRAGRHSQIGCFDFWKRFVKILKISRIRAGQ